MDFIRADFDGKFDEHHAVVRLTSVFSDDEIDELLASLSQKGATGQAMLTFLRSNKRPRRFRLSAREMDDLCERWTAFKQRIVEAKDAEEQRRVAIFDQARELVKGSYTDVEGLRIVVRKEEDAEHVFVVNVPAIGWSSDAAYGPDQLLEQVNGALEVAEKHIAWLEDNVLPDVADDHPTPSIAHNRAMVAAWRTIKPRPTAVCTEPTTEDVDAVQNY